MEGEITVISFYTTSKYQDTIGRIATCFSMKSMILSADNAGEMRDTMN